VVAFNGTVHNGWELLVQQRQDNHGRWETDFVTSSQNGEPQALYKPDGTLRWQAPKSTLWGQRPGSTEDSADPGLAFAGQYRDSESGLCYNRFRYYDPNGGCYVSPDPIGVLGGESNYAYVPNPHSWVDPFGLAGCPEIRQRVLDNVAASKVARESSSFSRASRSAEAAADNALVSGKMTGAAAELRIGNRVFTGVSGEVVTHNPRVTAALMGTPHAQRAPWHGGCAEIVCLDKALNAGVNVAGASARAVNIGVSGLGHNTAKAVCTSCNDILRYFGVIF
jgi:RHS repeat-associated protein